MEYKRNIVCKLNFLNKNNFEVTSVNKSCACRRVLGKKNNIKSII